MKRIHFRYSTGLPINKMEFKTGNYYHLRFYDNDADDEIFIDGIQSISGTHRLIGNGQIGEYKYYLFKNPTTKTYIEVMPGGEAGTFISLFFYYSNKLEIGYYSDYAREGEDIEFGGPRVDMDVNVEISYDVCP